MSPEANGMFDKWSSCLFALWVGVNSMENEHGQGGIAIDKKAFQMPTIARDWKGEATAALVLNIHAANVAQPQRDRVEFPGPIYMRIDAQQIHYRCV
tara:strand:- start:40 stop:330 length:291 start_codon:yes stop_codon:yes gene_type:complete